MGNKSRSSLEVITEDGILGKIISLLTLKEAVRTCVLSRRWRCIWTYLHTLNFDFDSFFHDTTLHCFKSLTTASQKSSFLMGRTNQFIQSVDSALQLHQGSALHSFSIRYFLYKPHSEHLDAWVRFAVAKKTKKLALHLEQRFSQFDVELYEFPFHLLGGPSIEYLFLAGCTLKPTCNFDGLLHLNSLVLWGTDATQENINLLLSNCPALERLALVKSEELVVLSIPGSLTKLRRLVVKECYQLRRMDVDAVNLNYFCYLGCPVDFRFRQSVHLKEAKIYFTTEGSAHNFNFYVDQLASSLPHLQSLILNITCISELRTVEDLSKGSCKFVHLQRLEWECPEWTISVDISRQLATLLDVAPCLKELKLGLSTSGVEQPPRRLRKLMKTQPRRPHSHLRTVDVRGFHFEKWQLQIVLYLLNNATKLELMTLQKGRDTEINKRVIQELSQEVPRNAKLAIL